MSHDIDFSALNLRDTLDLAIAMVRDSGGELHVAHAWGLEGEATLRSSAIREYPQ